jgi:4-diphosphocytidyl-2-C-methyl-D-erythritol kinase
VRLSLRAHAKINYALEVLGVRENGYHEVRTVMQSVSLADQVELESSASGFELHVRPEGAEVGPLGENTVYRAWNALREASGRELPVRIGLHKRIPPGAGLGGGSADAAAVIHGLNALFGLGIDDARLGEIGASIGADVPFCLAGGTALGEGIGDRLTPLPAPPDHRLVLAKPVRGADTGEIYRLYDGRPRDNVCSAAEVAAALRSGDLDALAGAVGNDLEPVTGGLVPDVVECRRELLSAGALGAAMTGTGTALYGVFRSASGARAAERELAAAFIGLSEPVRYGVDAV